MTQTRVRILAFARIAEIAGTRERTLDLPAGATASDAWAALARETPALEALEGSTRIARNGSIVSGDVRLEDGDELAFLPPAGGG